MSIDGSKYEPSIVTVKRGVTVTFVNADPFPHTVTSAGHFDSRSIAPNAGWSYHATTTGEFPYICSLHPNMRGVLRVE